MKIDGIRIYNYRSFNEKGIQLNDLGKINVFIGKNNSGKSNVLKFIAELNKCLYNKSNIPPFDEDDYFDHDTSRKISWEIEYKKASGMRSFLGMSNQIDSVLLKESALFVQFAQSNDERTRYQIAPSNFNWFEKLLPTSSIELSHLRNEVLGDVKIIDPHQIHLALFQKVVLTRELNEQKIYFIGTFRRISKKDLNERDEQVYENELMNGTNLIRHLNKILRPESSRSKLEKEKSRKIHNFLRDVLNYPDAEIVISNNESQLSIDTLGRQIRFENLGTGVQQLLILAISVTLVENAIICLEEPEIFLHPEIQKKFIKFLLTTKNQYFISTHANSFMNISGIEIYHVTNDGNKSQVTKLVNGTDKNQMLDDLGYHASDLLQSNYILWVEGPSDRIYVNHWINDQAPDLVEGEHYSIMFYGGHLRSHLTVDETTIKDFINLNKINRNVGILQDSDRESENQEINDSKKRLIREFTDCAHFNWLTKGRTIENYIESTVIETALKGLLKRKNIDFDLKDEFAPVTKYSVNGEEKIVNKVALAREITKEKLSLKILDLENRISELVNSIRQANGKMSLSNG